MSDCKAFNKLFINWTGFVVKDHAEKVDRYGVVSNLKIAKIVEKIDGPLSDVEVKTFELEDEEAARQWLL
ncbi:STAS/SEC14 domain-containing protein [Amphibacillus marinus]|uniref:STAS/SEC14 domain-containing protein n=1 Tax=Amphibacillus marinus TaxID=872970 RepID=UPI003183E835